MIPLGLLVLNLPIISATDTSCQAPQGGLTSFFAADVPIASRGFASFAVINAFAASNHHC
jgi:hypothetical protein